MLRTNGACPLFSLAFRGGRREPRAQRLLDQRRQHDVDDQYQQGVGPPPRHRPARLIREQRLPRRHRTAIIVQAAAHPANSTSITAAANTSPGELSAILLILHGNLGYC